MGDITAANATITLAIPPLFSIPQQLQGFGVDDVFDVPAIQSVETLMGVDGVLSMGFVFKPIMLDITLQADSVSNAVFDQWWTAMTALLVTYRANGLIKLPGVSTKFTLTNGGLTSYKPTPKAGNLLRQRTHQITFGSIAPAPA